jgi:hypothetical protein
VHKQLAWSRLVNDYYYISGTVLIGLGIFIGFFGNKHFNLTMSIYTAMLTFVVIMTLCSWWTWLEHVQGQIFFTLIALLASFGSAKLALKKERIGMWMINLGTSFHSSCIVYDSILFLTGYESFALLLCLTISFGILVAIWTKQNKAWLRPFCLSVMSGYLVMRGVSYWSWGWPNDLQMYSKTA